MKTFKRYISLLLAVLMITTSFPLIALADEIQDMEGFDENVRWSYTAENDTLYINGKNIYLENSGAYPTYIDGEYVNVSFSHLIIGNEVKNILLKSGAATPNENLPYYSKSYDVSFEEGSSLLNLGNYAFFGSSVTSMVLPKSLTTLSATALSYATKLVKLDMSDTAVTKLPVGAFQGDWSLVEIKLPKGITEIPKNCFAGLNRSLTTVEIPDTVTTISDYAFNDCKNLQLDKLPKSLNKVGNSAFYGCTSAHFEVTSNIKTLDEYAFAESGVTKVKLSGAYANNYSFYHCRDLKSADLNNYSIGTYAFTGCSALESVVISGTAGTIYPFAFAYCSSLSTVSFSGSIGLETLKDSCFKECTSLENVQLPETVSRIETYVFDGCKQLKNINLHNTKITYLAEGCFRNTSITKVIPPETVKSIGKLCFAGCKNIEYFEISASTERFENNFLSSANVDTLAVFNRKFDFTYINDISSINTIKGYLGSTAKKYATDNNIAYIEIGSAEDGKISELSGTIALNNSDYAAWYVTDDLELVIEGEGALTGLRLYNDNNVSILVSKMISDYQINSITFSEGITSIPEKFAYTDVYGLSTKSLHSISLPSTLESIGASAFMGTDIDSLVIPENVTYIGSSAFNDAGLAGGVTINAPIKTLNSKVFYNCKFEEFVIPNTVTTVGNSALNKCTNLKLVVIPESVTKIGTDSYPKAIGFSNATSGDSRVSGLVIKCVFGTAGHAYASMYKFPVDVDMYGEYVSGYFTSEKIAKWYYYPETKNVYILPCGTSFLTESTTKPMSKPDVLYDVLYDDGSVVQLGDLDVDTVYYSYGLTMISTLSPDTQLSPLYVFNPKHIEFSDSLNCIDGYSFAELTRLEEINIPLNLDYIFDHAFDGCSCKMIDFSNSNYSRTLPENLFADNNTLEVVILNSKITQIYKNTFKNCTALKYINLENIKKIDSYAFYNCKSLDGIELGFSLTSVGSYAFAKCINVKYIDINSENLSLYSGSFADLPFCDTINIHSNIKNSGTSPFRNCGSSTTGVHLSFSGQDVSRANLKAFEKCNVTELHIGEDIDDFNYFSLPNLEKITVDERNERFFVYDNCLYAKYDDYDKVEIYLELVPQTMTEVEIFDGTTCIDMNAFAYGKIRNVTIPEGVTYIYDCAFECCTELRKINLPTTLEVIDNLAFADCSKLRIVSIPSCEEIAYYAFADCTNLSSILLPSNINTIKEGVFNGCTSLKSIVIPENCKNIKNYAFGNCSALTDVYMFETSFLKDTFYKHNPDLTIHTMVGSTPYQLALQYGINVDAYTDEDIFRDECAMMEDIYEGFIGFCGDEHGDIQYLTVYEPTCTQDGYVVGVCEYCSVILEEHHYTAQGHNYVNTVFIPATSTTQSVAKYECTNCGDVYTVYSPPLSSDTQKTTCRITGQAVIANDKTAENGSTPLADVSIQLGGETLAVSNKKGEFSFFLETGVYELILHYNYGFNREVYLVVTDEDIDMGVVPVIACDWNKDGVIDDDDYTLFKFVIGSTKDSPSYLDFVDMNNDGKINVKDLVYMNNVKGLDSKDFDYPSIIIGA